MEIDIGEIEIKEDIKLGSGFISEVFLGLHRKTKKQYAIKIVK